jgi:hypothetical protein
MQWSKRFGLPTSADVKALGVAIADLRQRDPRAEIATALFLPQADICLPVRDVDKPEDSGNDVVRYSPQVCNTSPSLTEQ